MILYQYVKKLKEEKEGSVYSGVFAGLNPSSWPHPEMEGHKLEESLGKIEATRILSA
jgi:hypothetical protein